VSIGSYSGGRPAQMGGRGRAMAVLCSAAAARGLRGGRWLPRPGNGTEPRGAAMLSTATTAIRPFAVSVDVSAPTANTEYEVQPARSRAGGSSGQTLWSACAQTTSSYEPGLSVRYPVALG
jgi:hypothetical protein